MSKPASIDPRGRPSQAIRLPQDVHLQSGRFVKMSAGFSLRGQPIVFPFSTLGDAHAGMRGLHVATLDSRLRRVQPLPC